MALTGPQQQALAHIVACAREGKTDAQAVIAHVLRMSAIPPEAFEDLVDRVRMHARVALHFHPDRPQADGVTVLAGLMESGVYKSQFETGLSSGSVSAHAGGARDRLEQELFGGAYHADGVTPDERPKYGSLDLLAHSDGPSPRFGSCYLLLRSAITQRCTFTYLDSFRTPAERGTLEEPDVVLAALLAECFEREAVLGAVQVRPPELVSRLRERLDDARPDRRTQPARCLDYYVEAQVHGAVSLSGDAEMIVADPCFRETVTGRQLRALCERYGIELAWHPGFRLHADAVPSDFRGSSMPSLARRIAADGHVDAHRIGQAAQDLQRQPGAWADRGTPAEVLQELKLLWHCLVKYGEAGASAP